MSSGGSRSRMGLDGEPTSDRGLALQLDLDWDGAEASVRERVVRWLRGEDLDVRATPSQRVVGLRRAGDCDLAVKRVGARGGLRGWGDRLRGHRAEREWKIWTALHRADVPVPAPLGRARGPGSDQLMVAEWVEGPRLAEAIAVRGAGSPAARRALLREVGEAVGRLHASGVTHGDLHVGNVLVDAATQSAVIVDFQRARRQRLRSPGWRRARLRDLGALDFSLAHAGVGRADRLRMRVAALTAEGAAEPSLRRAQRAVGEASRRFAQRYYHRRTRRADRPGRRFAHFSWSGAEGLRSREIDPNAAIEALRRHRSLLAPAPGGQEDGEVLKDDHRSRITGLALGERRVVVKEVVKAGLTRRLADCLRGSPARRAWRAGHGLAARGIAAARPLAYVERRRFGIPLESLVVLEDLRPAPPASQLAAGDRAGFAALARLARRLHARGVVHGDLQALHVYLVPKPGGVSPTLIDLEGVRFAARPGDESRLRGLAELNASLPDAAVSPRERKQAFLAYARALPFRRGTKRALEEVVRRSLLRRHAWRGRECDAERTAGLKRGGP